MKRKPNGYWKDIENVKKELELIMEEYSLNSMPSQAFLKLIEFTSISSAIASYHGGFNNICAFMGLKSNKKTHGYWNNEDRIINKMNEIMKNHNLKNVPTGPKIVELGYSSFYHGVTRHFGYYNLKKLYDINELDRRPGYWTNIDNTINYAKKIIGKNKWEKLPSSNILNKKGYSNLANAIIRHHGGFIEFRKKIGENNIQNKKGMWKDLDYTKKQAKKVIKKLNCTNLPTFDILSKNKFGGLANAISKYHGGMHEFRKKLGENNTRVKPHSWKSLDFTNNEVNKIIEKNNFETLPSMGELCKLGHSSLCFAISKYHGGFYEFRKNLNIELGIQTNEINYKKPKGYWDKIEIVINEAKKFIEKYKFDILPSPKKINNLGYSSLSVAIVKYHGGFPYFRALLNKELGIESEKDRLENVLKEYIGKNGKE